MADLYYKEPCPQEYGLIAEVNATKVKVVSPDSEVSEVEPVDAREMIKFCGYTLADGESLCGRL